VSSWDEKRAAHRADHEAGRHADREEYVTGCPLCDAEWKAVEAKRRADRKATAAAEQRAERDAARVRAAWLAANPEAIAWRCASCGEEFTDGDADQGQGPLYECDSCGAKFSLAGSADGDSNRCPECNRFGRKLAELSCPACEDGGLEPVGPGADKASP
jgi:DNA-directed RNA polymerase subunit RPC12/RpoP